MFSYAVLCVLSSFVIHLALPGEESRHRGYKLEYILKLKIKRNDWLLADTCLQAANHCALF